MSASAEVGDELPPWTMEHVSAERMKTAAAIFRDPNPLHWDRSVAAEKGLGERVVNQSPINLGYVANMLMAYAGPRCIRRLRVSFPGVVLDGDRVRARGIIREITHEGDARVAECEVWLEHEDGARAVEGRAWIALGSAP